MTGFLDMPCVSAAGGAGNGDNSVYSLMLDSGASQYLSFTGTIAAGSTYSGSFKLGKMGTVRPIVEGSIKLNADDTFTAFGVTTSAKLRAPDGHYFFHVSNNGVYLSTGSSGSPMVNHGTPTVTALTNPRIGFDGTNYFDGYLANLRIQSGVTGTYTDTTRVSADTGQAVNKNGVSSYGAAGARLEFANSSALGTDTSGNGNHWTTNGGINSTNQVSDTPTNNYAVLNPLLPHQYYTLSAGNLKYTNPTGSSEQLSVAGWNSIAKQHYEFTGSSQPASNTYTYVGDSACYYCSNGQIYVNGSLATTVGQYTNGERISFDVVVGGAVTIKRNGTVIYTSSSGVGSGSLLMNTHGGGVWHCNFGQRPFVDTPLTGHVGLCTANLPVPAIPDPTKHHYVALVAKSGDTSFTLPWDATVYDTLFEGKIRNTTGDWFQVDGLRGYDRILHSNTTGAETTDANVIGVVGTTVTLKSSLPDGSYLVRCYKAGLVSARQTNTNGTITSTVSANQLSGFSIVTTTGPGSIGTVGHGLLKPLEMIVEFSRNAVTNHFVWHTSLGATQVIEGLNTTNAASTQSTFNNTLPTSTVFSAGADLVVSSRTYVFYCHHSVEGYSKFGSWTNNNSTDGTFTSCGISPLDMTMKNYDNVENWYIRDSARQPYNVAAPSLNWLCPNQNNAEGTYGANTAAIDFTAAGFKIRTTNPASGEISYGTRPMIYALYGTSIKYATAR